MVSFLGLFQQILHTAFLVRYLVIQPVLLGLKAPGMHPVLDLLFSFLAAAAKGELPLD